MVLQTRLYGITLPGASQVQHNILKASHRKTFDKRWAMLNRQSISK